MANFFIAYERVSETGDIAAFEADISSLGEVVIVHDSLVLLKSTFDSPEVFNMLMGGAGESIRLTIIPANASASLMNSRPGVIESFKRIVEV
jgi:hypothetical protein